MSSFVCVKPIRIEEELLSRTRDGDQRSFAELIQRHHTVCVSTVTRCSAKGLWVGQRAAGSIFTVEGEILPWLLRIVNTESLISLRVKRRMTLFIYSDGNGP